MNKKTILSTSPVGTCGIGITNGYLYDEIKKMGVTLTLITKQQSINPLNFYCYAVNAGKKGELVHVQYNNDCFGRLGRFHGFMNPITYMTLNALDKKVITTIHELPEKATIGYKALFFFPTKFSDHLIVTTNKTKERLVKDYNVKEEKISVIPLGTKTPVTIIPKEKAKKALGLTNKRVITLHGFVEPNKGHLTVIKALKHLPENYIFLIAGGTHSKKGEDYLKEIKESSKEFPERIKITGITTKEQLPIIIGASDVLVFPYHSITSSLAWTTCMPFRVPIITSDIQPFKEFNQMNGCTMLFHENNDKELAHKIKLLIEGYSFRKKVLSRINVFEKDYSWKKIAEKTMKVYNSVA